MASIRWDSDDMWRDENTMTYTTSTSSNFSGGSYITAKDAMEAQQRLLRQMREMEEQSRRMQMHPIYQQQAMPPPYTQRDYGFYGGAGGSGGHGGSGGPRPQTAPVDRPREYHQEKPKHVCKETCKEEHNDFYEGIVTYHRLSNPKLVKEEEKICKNPKCLLARIKTKI